MIELNDLLHRMEIEEGWNQEKFYQLLLRLSNHGSPGTWLDLGCGRGPKSPELMAMTRELIGRRPIVGLDVDARGLRRRADILRVQASAEAMPFADGCFVLVSANMVVEHVEEPSALFREARRVLDEKGILIVHTSSARHYMLSIGGILSRLLSRRAYVRLAAVFSGREPDDIFPTRYRANSALALRRGIEEAGFTVRLVFLETPLAFSSWRGRVERRVRHLLPPSMKSTLLAVCEKRRSFGEGAPEDG